MKQILASAALVLISSSAFAWPAVGDATQYQVTAGTNTATLELSVQSIDMAQDTVVIQQLMKFGAQQQSQNTTVKYSGLVKEQQEIPQALLNCAAVSGTAETITVPAGTFPTCKMAVNNSTQTGFQWIGNVIFGVVKQDVTATQSGQHQVLELQAQTGN